MVKPKKQKVRFKKRKVFGQGSNRIKIIIKFLIAVLVLAGIGIALLRLKYMFVDSEYFMIKQVDVELHDEGGILKHRSLDDIIEGEVVGANIFFIDLDDFDKKIENAHPEFKDVAVRRLLPDKLIVQAKLRKAIAQIRSDRYYFVDKEGFLLPDVKNFPDPALPIITGIGVNLAKVQTSKFSKFEKDRLNKALNIIKEIQDIEILSKYKLKMIDITDPGNLSFFFTSVNVEIKIGNSDFRNRLKVLATVFGQLGPDIGNFKYIDLRFEDPIVGPR